MHSTNQNLLFYFALVSQVILKTAKAPGHQTAAGPNQPCCWKARLEDLTEDPCLAEISHPHTNKDRMGT